MRRQPLEDVLVQPVQPHRLPLLHSAAVGHQQLREPPGVDELDAVAHPLGREGSSQRGLRPRTTLGAPAQIEILRPFANSNRSGRATRPERFRGNASRSRPTYDGPVPFEIPLPDIDPAIHLGPLTVHWYGVMYLVGFVVAWLLGRYRASRPRWAWTNDDVADLILYAALGVIAGGRIGYVLFYGLDRFLADPLYLVKLSDGGMSFHGGLAGVLLALVLFARKQKRRFWEVMDFIAPLVPPGLFFGRIGNFINGELWGAPTDLPWAMAFPSGGGIPRHPSMLYEALLEGLVLFVILWWFSSRRPPVRAVSGVFLLGYGTFRFLIEFVREPDAHLGYLAGGWFTMGMLLTVPMLLGGLVLLWFAYRDPVAPQTPQERAESVGADAPEDGDTTDDAAVDDAAVDDAATDDRATADEAVSDEAPTAASP